MPTDATDARIIGVARDGGEADEADEREHHPDHPRVWQRVAIGVEADRRLEQCAGNLKGQRDQPDPGEVEGELDRQDGIDSRNERLDCVVQQVGRSQREQHGHVYARFSRRARKRVWVGISGQNAPFRNFSACSTRRSTITCANRCILAEETRRCSATWHPDLAQTRGRRKGRSSQTSSFIHTVLCFSFEVPLLASMAAWAAARRAMGTRKGEQLT